MIGTPDPVSHPVGRWLGADANAAAFPLGGIGATTDWIAGTAARPQRIRA